MSSELLNQKEKVCIFFSSKKNSIYPTFNSKLQQFHKEYLPFFQFLIDQTLPLLCLCVYL